MSERGSPETEPEPGGRAPEVLPRGRRAALLVRGALAASRLGLSTIAGAAGAFVALLPVILDPVPSGQASADASRIPDPSSGASEEPLAG